MITDGTRLSNLLDETPMKYAAELRKKIVKDCGISMPTLYCWKNGKSRIPYLAKKEIEKIFSEYEGVNEKHIFPELHPIQ